ncbi:hypothetical protein BCR37DRAFT_20810 [Protomyces lactucae-debilis]|uniref:Uncharacterized protein n=1 Tax=Protomyces lactucae-debilis TaxID=2754530 RepID=A0A1Y2FVM3_PROLT|nr:uncharacterized protein BCR37DRAFT_20810 [Protomyces lactucae-debilis]ORY88009.1 hypothetical protein BCR37DRAFT_20810 [Protomyces lactucae-debilis]
MILLFALSSLPHLSAALKAVGEIKHPFPSNKKVWYYTDQDELMVSSHHPPDVSHNLMTIYHAKRKRLQKHHYNTFFMPNISDPSNIQGCWLAKPDRNVAVWDELLEHDKPTTHNAQGEVLCCGNLINYRPTKVLPGPETAGLGWNRCWFESDKNRHGGYTIASCQQYELEQKDPRPANWHVIGAPFKSGISKQEGIYFVEYDKQAKLPKLSFMTPDESFKYSLQPNNDSAMHFWLAKPDQADNFPATWLTDGYALIGGKLTDMKPVDPLPFPNSYPRDTSIKEHEGQDFGNLCFFALDYELWLLDHDNHSYQGLCREVRKFAVEGNNPA